jgi:hypothetical protein
MPSYQRGPGRRGGSERKFHRRLPGYFFIFVKVIENDQGSYYDSFLILLAKRFNSAYYLLLDTGKASGGEASKVWLTLSRVVEKRQIHGLPKFYATVVSAVED